MYEALIAKYNRIFEDFAKNVPTSGKVAGKLTSTYVDVYSDELYQLLLRNAKECKNLNKTIRKINKDLTARGYEDKNFSASVRAY